MSALYTAFCVVCVTVLKEVNRIVDEPYMDEPFHVPQAQAFCRGEYSVWDPKITTPPGLYIMSVVLKKIFMFRCTLPMLRLTTMLSLLALPIVLTRLLCHYQRQYPPQSWLRPTPDAIIISAFPIAWFFGFLYYTEVPSLLFVAMTMVAAFKGHHWIAALTGGVSCTFRQTNVVWVLYAYASSQLVYLRFRRARPGDKPVVRFHDPPALEAAPGDIIRSLLSVLRVLPDILPSFLPYSLVLTMFAAFTVWNGGIVLGDKENHTLSIHVPQLYYFAAFSSLFGFPVLISGKCGVRSMVLDVWSHMFGSRLRTVVSAVIMAVMGVTIHLFTIHHPFLLSDNRHLTFYVWHRIFMRHPCIPFLFIPGYLACAWAWFLRAGRDQTLLQTLILPVFVTPTLVLTPLLEPRYFLTPYILLRAQIVDTPAWALVVEGVWYTMINAATMSVFLYKERAGVGRFMW